MIDTVGSDGVRPNIKSAVQESMSRGGIVKTIFTKEKNWSVGGVAKAFVALAWGLGSLLISLILVGMGFFFWSLRSEPEADSSTFAFGAILCFLAAALIMFLLFKYQERVLYPNVFKAQRILKGFMPLDELVQTLNAREPSRDEKNIFANALSQLQKSDGELFYSWYVIPKSLPIVLGLGNVLFVSREALDGDDFVSTLSHQIGKLHTGDSWVRLAIWQLGKGLFQDRITILGSVVEDEGEGNDRMAINMGLSLAGGWERLAADLLINAVLNSGGKMVQSMLPEIGQFFTKWDLEADKIAVGYRGKEAYLPWLEEIANMENRLGSSPFNAPAEMRLDRVKYS